MSGGGYGGQPQGYGGQSFGQPQPQRYGAFGGMPQPRQQFFNQGQQGFTQSFYNPMSGRMEQNQTMQPKGPYPETGGLEPMPNNLREPPTGGLEPWPTDPIQTIGNRARMYQNYGITGPQGGAGMPLFRGGTPGWTGVPTYIPSSAGMGANPVNSPDSTGMQGFNQGTAVASRSGMGMVPTMSEPAQQRQAPAGYYFNQDGMMLQGSDPNKAAAMRPSYAGSIPNNGLRPTGPTTLPAQYNIGRPPPIGSQHYDTWASLYGGGGDYMPAPKIPWGPGNPVYDSIAMTYPGR